MSQDLVGLIGLLRQYLVDLRASWGLIVTALSAASDLAENEVARHLVASKLKPSIELGLESSDPRERAHAMQLVSLVYGRSDAIRVFRRFIKDPNAKVRRAVVHGLRRLWVDDVALPDTRYAPTPYGSSFSGGWNVSGWRYGLRIKPHDPFAHRVLPKKELHETTRRCLGELPRLDSVEDLAALVGLSSVQQLKALSRPGVRPSGMYVEIAIPKSSGKPRMLHAPCQPLKRVQRVILHRILEKIPSHTAAHGFVKGRSVLTNAFPHQDARLIVKMDLREFFPSVHASRVKGLFQMLGYRPEVAQMLANLTTYTSVSADGKPQWPGRLPQGAPTSPAIANLVCRRLDARLSGLAESMGGAYTRYADDLTFSFHHPPEDVGRLFWWVDGICQQEGFEENTSKRRVLRAGQAQRVTGVNVSGGLFVPRAEKRRFRAILANCRKYGVESQARGNANFSEVLVGYASYVKMIQPELGGLWLREARAILRAVRALLELG